MENMDKAPYLASKCTVDDLYLSQDIPRKKYDLKQLPYAKVSIENMSRLAYYRAKDPVKVPSLISNLKFDVSLGAAIGFNTSESENVISHHLSQ